MNTLTDRIRLNNGTSIPCLAFGTYKIKDPAEAYNSVKSALEIGYRHIDTAAFYENEKQVGQAINDFIATGAAKREDIFVTSKVWKSELGYKKTLAAFEKTMSEIDQMKLDMVTKLALLLMEEQPELTMEQALSIVLNSDTYQRLLEDNTALYYQSPRYVFSFLQTELQTGKVG